VAFQRDCHGRRKRGLVLPWILKISAKKGCFLSFVWEKQISPLLALPCKNFGKIPWWPAWKKSFRRPWWL